MSGSAHASVRLYWKGHVGRAFSILFAPGSVAEARTCLFQVASLLVQRRSLPIVWRLRGRTLFGVVRFFWNATRGHRLRPWHSPYLRWRVETYTGKRAETLRLRDFGELIWTERGQMLRFLAWTREMRAYADDRGGH